jgi:hypothetical protein
MAVTELAHRRNQPTRPGMVYQPDNLSSANQSNYGGIEAPTITSILRLAQDGEFEEFAVSMRSRARG